MAKFTDAEREIWNLRVDITVARHLKQRLGFDVMGLPKAKWAPMEEVMSDPEKLCNVLYVVCENECVAKNISDEDFGRRLYGDAIENASMALIEALGDFFPSPSHRALLRKLAQAARNAWSTTEKAAMADLDAISEEKLTEMMIALVPRNSGEPPTEPPAS